MAKSKSFFGLRRGSTKSLTFSVLNGQQITKDRVYGGKNPRSLAQMIQRMCLATASAGYASMKQIVDHSFEGISYGANTMAEFIKVNTKLIKADYETQGEAFAYNPYGDRGLKVGAYKMSKGTAPALALANYSGVKSTGVLTISKSIAASGDITFDMILNKFGLAVGEMGTYCFLYPLAGSADDWAFGFVRITALQGGTTVATSENFAQCILVESNLNLSTLQFTGGSVNIVVDTPNDVDLGVNVPGCVIHSVKSNGAWLRSEATMDVPNDTDVAPTAEDALATYPIGESYVLNGGEIE